jgi:hypothetical protein
MYLKSVFRAKPSFDKLVSASTNIVSITLFQADESVDLSWNLDFHTPPIYSDGSYGTLRGIVRAEYSAGTPMLEELPCKCQATHTRMAYGGAGSQRKSRLRHGSIWT